MLVREISNRTTNNSENNIVSYFEELKTSDKTIQDKNEINIPYSSWQKNVLLDAITKLENNIQLDDIHPLDKKSAAPIESYEEALIELSFTKSDTFKNEAVKAQANISNKDVAHLFTEN